MNFFNFKTRLINRKNKGFTMIEVMTCITIIMIAFVAIFTLINDSMAFHDLAYSRLTASYLAQEGIEIVRNIRDTNYLNDRPWNTGLTKGDYQVQYDSTELEPYNNDRLLLDSETELYNYNSGTPTRYKRKINIKEDADYTITVTSIVSWSNRGGDFDIKVEDHLFDWQ